MTYIVPCCYYYFCHEQFFTLCVPYEFAILFTLCSMRLETKPPQNGKHYSSTNVLPSYISDMSLGPLLF